MKTMIILKQTDKKKLIPLTVSYARRSQWNNNRRYGA